MNVKDWLGKGNKLGEDIWNKKYKYENETFEEWLDRISHGNKDLKNIILEKKFLFGGRILANRGLQNKGLNVTYSNCYVLKPPDDSIEDIFDCSKKLARTFSYGGGVGIDIGKLRPKNSKVNNSAKYTTGATSFMQLYSMVTEIIGQMNRRGALMISIPCNHPDLEEFIEIKSDLEKVTKANISIRITNEFMRAVKENSEYELTFTIEPTGEVITKKVNAKNIFKKIAKMNHEMAEPGVLFWDTIESYNLMSSDDNFKYAGTNPCAEEPLPAGGSCLLGSINLSEFVNNKKFDFKDFEKVVKIATTALNVVLDEGLELHPLKEQRESVRDWKQIGLGIFGLADMLIKMEVAYGSKESLDICEKIGFTLINSSLQQSALIAKEKGCFPKCNIDKITSSHFFKSVANTKTIELVNKFGLRNSQVLTCAPTGSISTMLGVSGGLEPIFANYYTRKTESLHNKDTYYKVYTPIAQKYLEENQTDKLPSYFVESKDLNFVDRINMQSVWQKYIDASISSTVNLPNEATIEDVENLYMYAWEKGLKGITVYRSGCAREGILTTDAPPTQSAQQIKYDTIIPQSRKEIGTTNGQTYCKKTACGTLYITINKDSSGNVVESFVNTSKGGICQATIGAVNRMISVALRSGVKVSEIVDQLKGITCQACVKTMTKGNALDGISCPDIIAKTLLEFSSNYDIEPPKPIVKHKTKQNHVSYEKCPDCGSEIRNEGGCKICVECGYSKCE